MHPRGAACPPTPPVSFRKSLCDQAGQPLERVGEECCLFCGIAVSTVENGTKRDEGGYGGTSVPRLLPNPSRTKASVLRVMNLITDSSGSPGCSNQTPSFSGCL